MTSRDQLRGRDVVRAWRSFRSLASFSSYFYICGRLLHFRLFTFVISRSVLFRLLHNGKLDVNAGVPTLGSCSRRT